MDRNGQGGGGGGGWGRELSVAACLFLSSTAITITAVTPRRPLGHGPDRPRRCATARSPPHVPRRRPPSTGGRAASTTQLTVGGVAPVRPPDVDRRRHRRSCPCIEARERYVEVEGRGGVGGALGEGGVLGGRPCGLATLPRRQVLCLCAGPFAAPPVYRLQWAVHPPLSAPSPRSP